MCSHNPCFFFYCHFKSFNTFLLFLIHSFCYCLPHSASLALIAASGYTYVLNLSIALTDISLEESLASIHRPKLLSLGEEQMTNPRNRFPPPRKKRVSSWQPQQGDSLLLLDPPVLQRLASALPST